MGWLRRDSGMSVFVNVRLTPKRGALERGDLELPRDSTVFPILTPTNNSHCLHKQKQSQLKYSSVSFSAQMGERPREDSWRKPSSKTLRRKPRREATGGISPAGILLGFPASVAVNNQIPWSHLSTLHVLSWWPEQTPMQPSKLLLPSLWHALSRS